MATGMAVMLVTVCVVVGFKQTITEKIAGFGAHIQVVNFENNNTFEMQPIEVTDSLIKHLAAMPHVNNVSRFITKPGILKTESEFEGVVLKGTDYWDYFAHNLVRGELPVQTQDILLSQTLCQLLQVDTGQYVFCYFVGDEVRVRKLHITGVYATGFSDFDRRFLVGQIPLVRVLNEWDSTQVSGIEILVDDFRYLNETADAVYFATANRLDEEATAMYTQTIEQLNPQIFSWLDLLDMNVLIIIVLMLCVSGFSIVSGLIILILDSVQLIGVLKALGATSRFVRRIFITQATMLIGKSMMYGNIVGLALCTLQYLFHVIPLDASAYYVNYVPIVFPWGLIVALNIGTLLISMVILLAPSAVVSKISPVKVMHFE